jgi:hypothetical protein
MDLTSKLYGSGTVATGEKSPDILPWRLIKRNILSRMFLETVIPEIISSEKW